MSVSPGLNDGIKCHGKNDPPVCGGVWPDADPEGVPVVSMITHLHQNGKGNICSLEKFYGQFRAMTTQSLQRSTPTASALVRSVRPSFRFRFPPVVSTPAPLPIWIGPEQLRVNHTRLYEWKSLTIHWWCCWDPWSPIDLGRPRPSNQVCSMAPIYRSTPRGLTFLQALEPLSFESR